jgi:opacity protein-like surface antigen
MFAALVFASGLLAFTAQAQEKPWYLMLNGGITSMSGSGGFDGNGYRVELIGGYNITRWLGIELQAGMLKIKPKSNQDNRLSGNTYSGNLVLRYANQSRWTPYIGGGLGGANGDFLGLTYQGKAGICYRFSEHWSADFGYEYLHIQETSDRSSVNHAGMLGVCYSF